MKTEKIIAVGILGAGFASLFLFRNEAPVVRLAAATLGMIFVIKIAALLWQRADGLRFRWPLGFLLFLFAWPGISAEGFTEKSEVNPQTGARFPEAWLSFLAGVALWLASSLAGRGVSTPWNYVSLFAVFLVVHLGLLEVIADGIRLLGFRPRSLFDRPFLARTLQDFWSVRWNRAFVDMNKLFLLTPLREKVPRGVLLLSIFVISGLLHELGISFTAGLSWGKPFLYFVLQGLGMELERKRPLPRPVVWVWILLPFPLLFPPAFVNLFLGTPARELTVAMASLRIEELFRYGLLLGGAFHLLVLCASVQVPGKLKWGEELPRLSNLNRKVFWTYGGYIASIIVYMAITSFVLSRGALGAANPAVFLWLLFIALFWWARVGIDQFYMNHADWPEGPLFRVGHVCLTTLFLSMAALYTLLAGMAWVFR